MWYQKVAHGDELSALLREGIGMTQWGMDIGDRIIGIPRSKVM